MNFNFTEANAWQYLFAAQHDIQGQAALAGGDSAFLAKIDAMFNAPVQTTGRVQPDITGLRGQYAHGNEPSHHVSYLASIRRGAFSNCRKGQGHLHQPVRRLPCGFVRQRGLRTNERLVRVECLGHVPGGTWKW